MTSIGKPHQISKAGRKFSCTLTGTNEHSHACLHAACHEKCKCIVVCISNNMGAANAYSVDPELTFLYSTLSAEYPKVTSANWRTGGGSLPTSVNLSRTTWSLRTFSVSPPRTILSRVFSLLCAWRASLALPCPNLAMYSFMLEIWSCSHRNFFIWASSSSALVLTYAS